MDELEVVEEGGEETVSAEPGDARLAAVLESVLFASGEPLTLRRLVEILGGPTPDQVREALAMVGERCTTEGRGVRLIEVAGGFQLRTAREHADYVRALFRERPRRLGRAALETLAVIAYRQPITRAEIEAIRGVDIDAVLTTLLQRNLVKVSGRKETVGRPLLYATTETFLELFGLRDLAELPQLKELPAELPVGGDGTDVIAEPESAGDAPAEAAESGGGELEAESGGADPGGEGEGERGAGEDAGDAGGSAPRQD